MIQNTTTMDKKLTESFDNTLALIRQRKYEESLEQILRLHDHALNHEPERDHGRYQFSLSLWEELGSVYPPAISAMRETRKQNLKLLKVHKEDHKLFHDIVELNERLGDINNTVQFFEELDHSQPEIARKFWNFAKNQIVAAKHYKLANKYFGNIVEKFQVIKVEFYENKKRHESGLFSAYFFKTIIVELFIQECVILIEVAYACHDEKTAKTMQQEALAIIDDPRLQNMRPSDESG